LSRQRNDDDRDNEDEDDDDDDDDDDFLLECKRDNELLLRAKEDGSP
jgi:hypothetical protein